MKFELKTFNQKMKISKPHFFILNKGMNSGKPLKKPAANCFVLTSDNEDLKTFYWLCYGLWKANSFHYYIVGSVVPFIRINDVKTHILSGISIVKANETNFKKSVKTLQLLELHEENLIKQIKTIKKYKKSLFYAFSKK